MIGATVQTRTIRLPYPHQGQQIVRRQERRFNWLCAGRRWRKTTLAMSIAVERAARGQRIVWGAPTYEQSTIGLEETRKAARDVAKFNLSRREAVFPTGGRILYRSLDDPDNVRGHTADGIVIDEVQKVKPAAYYEVLRPMLMDTGGWLWAIGTSNGLDWFWQERERAKTLEDSRAWSAPTLGAQIITERDGKGNPTSRYLLRQEHPLENPFVPFSEIDLLFNTTAEHVFRREILSDDEAAPGGLVYDVWVDNWDALERAKEADMVRDIALKTGAWPLPPALEIMTHGTTARGVQVGNVTPEADYVAGAGTLFWFIDDGYSAGSASATGGIDRQTGHYVADSHPRVFLLAQQKPTGHIDIFAEHWACLRLDDAHIAEVKELGYPLPDYAAVDKSAAALKGRLQEGGIYTRNGPADVLESIKVARGFIGPDEENGVRLLRVHPRCRHLRADMLLYRWAEVNKDNISNVQKPIKQYDHGPDALRYGLWTLRRER